MIFTQQMKKQKTGLGYAKVQALYLLKIKAVDTIRHLAVIIGRGESTVHRWLQTYKTGGLSLLLKEPQFFYVSLLSPFYSPSKSPRHPIK